MAAMAPDPSTGQALPQPKAIRFVTNHDGPYAKRRRINSACLTCRRRKTRCSGERPACETCLKNNHTCGGYGPDTDQPKDSSAPGSVGERRTSVATNPARRPSVAVARGPTPGQLQQTQQHQHQQAESVGIAHPRLAHDPPIDSPIIDPALESSFNGPASAGGDEGSQASSRLSLSLSIRNRMPYFRYFGPTAIMPGFKQMVVKVKGKQHSTGGTSTNDASLGRVTSQQSATENPTPIELPIYDASPVPPPPLLTHLCKTFFAHLGCNFPFLQEVRFMRDLEEKQVDAILVDSVCALAARFSTDPMLVGARQCDGDAEQPETPSSEYGQQFALRAKSAIVDTFACPSVAVVQAALLLAYDEFGGSRDSGLWMYLGIAIRMAQDLGMQTLQGLRYEGRGGPTPGSIKYISSRKKENVHHDEPAAPSPEVSDPQAAEEQRAVERERIDTFWAVFFLDRVVSSGTGRPVSLRDSDIELSFPSLDSADPSTGWPVPYPALIRVIHLYGRVTDLLNGIKEVSHVTPDVIKRLAFMESLLTDIYQNLSSRLHFNVLNFQHYLKNGQGTNFILLHFWFHTLIVLLHQPTLLKTFEGGIQQLLPNSHELSLSSAKTIADILAFAELADAKAGLGNPFTSQPIYIAACAFLKETAMQSASSNPHSRQGSPPSNSWGRENSSDSSVQRADARDGRTQTVSAEKQQKHTLLATAANQNYQRCYRALESLETYWAGVKYILTVLDQKAKGVVDPLLYTREEMECALEVPQIEPSFDTPGWRRKLSWGAYIGPQDHAQKDQGPVAAFKSSRGANFGIPGSVIGDPGQAIGWSLTGTMNSPSTSLAVMWPTETRDSGPRRPQDGMDASISSVMAQAPTSPQQQRNVSTPLPRYPNSTQIFAQPGATAPSMQPPPPPGGSSAYLSDSTLVSDADLLLNLHSPYSTTSSPAGGRPPPPGGGGGGGGGGGATAPSSAVNQQSPTGPYPSQMTAPPGQPHVGPIPFADMMVESQDIDMSALGDNMMSWLEWVPHEYISFFDPATGTAAAATAADGGGMGTGTAAPGQQTSGPGQAEQRRDE
ncbi:c6 transcription factor [Diplodia corticola]|uniref:C6 transcription factor n=1 Tax=Diplodia corticola TaxID=236234 RepID=A0A1J9QQU4_9PEZI|nr:c6 transcription factor [Diplodia corticola]OJD30824.1 c6 transcription factor [Diplodia corticola]